MSRTIILGDIHGESHKLKKVLSLCDFDYENDTLIQLGDVVDRGLDPFGCIFELLKIKKLQLIQGNHDWCFLNWVRTIGYNFNGQHGSSITMNEWLKLNNSEKLIVENFFSSQKLSLIDSQNRLFVHAGINVDSDIQIKEDLLWSRSFFMYLLSSQKNKMPKKLQKWNEIFVGHNATICFKRSKKGIISENNSNKKLGTTLPINIHNVWNIDTGSGFEGGVLTAMDIDTKEIWQIN